MIEFLNKEYTDEELNDLLQDVSDSVFESEEAHSICTDAQGFRYGTFKVVITWEDS